MHAFAKDSANNSLGGSGPLNARPDHSTIMGYHDDEAFKDYSSANQSRSGKSEAVVFDPKGRAILHGDESLGLGTSTFLEGTPVARTVIQRREQETAQESLENGLQRKKSLAQRFRNINRPPHPSGRITSPDTVRSPRSGDLPSAGSNERNPFFNEFEKNEEQISVRRKDSYAKSPTSPDAQPTLERRVTADADGGRPQQQGGGFIARVKSLKGGRRQAPPRPDRTDRADQDAPGSAM